MSTTDSHLLLTSAADLPTTSRSDVYPIPEQIGDGSTATTAPIASPMEVDVYEETMSVDSPSEPSSGKSSSTAYSFVGSALGDNSTAIVNSNILKNDAKNVAGSGNSTNNNNNANVNGGDSNINSNNTGNSASSSNAKSSANASAADDDNDSMFECNICLDTAKDAVVTMCGHLFCWPCLHQWLETRPNRKLCPVCKAAISKDKVIPLYGRNSTKNEDPRNKVPPRPAGQRTEPEPQNGFQMFGFGDGFHMSFGIGAFPFGYFASSFNFGDQLPTAANRGSAQYEDEQHLSKLFLYLAFICIAWLLFA